MSTEHISAVICTRNREDKIGTAIESVLANDYPSFDLTVIDQSTNDGTRRVVDLIATGDPRLHYVHVDEAGLSRAYNNGIGRTDGEILAFTDDDCIVAPDWLSTIARAFAAEPDGELLYGQVLAAGETADDVSKTPALEIPVAQRLSRKDGFKVFGMGANFAARRSLFRSIGGFDTVLGGGGALRSSQDFDLAYRAYRGGHVILLRPDVTLRHDGRRESDDWPALLTAYGTGDGAVYTKHVRCRDPYALWLLARRVASDAAKWVIKSIVRRNKPAEIHYVRGVLAGVRGSFEFKVDRAHRLYVDPTVPPPGTARLGAGRRGAEPASSVGERRRRVRRASPA
jgi:glycosyltransferase involved in cell wall biosynthesis